MSNYIVDLKHLNFFNLLMFFLNIIFFTMNIKISKVIKFLIEF